MVYSELNLSMLKVIATTSGSLWRNSKCNASNTNLQNQIYQSCTRESLPEMHREDELHIFYLSISYAKKKMEWTPVLRAMMVAS